MTSHLWWFGATVGLWGLLPLSFAGLLLLIREGQADAPVLFVFGTGLVAMTVGVLAMLGRRWAFYLWLPVIILGLMIATWSFIGHLIFMIQNDGAMDDHQSTPMLFVFNLFVHVVLIGAPSVVWLALGVGAVASQGPQDSTLPP